MRIKIKIQRIFPILIIFLLSSGSVVSNNDRYQELTLLFEQLKEASTILESSNVEKKIWSLWMMAPDSESQKLLEKGTSLMQAGDFNRALDSFDKLIDRVPSYAEAWNKRATLHFLMDNYVLSLKDIAKTLALEPNHFGAISGMALIQLKLNNPVKALKYYQMALLIGPNLSGIKQNTEYLQQQLSQESI